MKIKTIIGLIGLLSIIYTQGYAQNFKAEAILDSNQILIGDQIHVDFTLTMPQNSTVPMPTLTQEMLSASGIDLVNSSAIDTNISGQEIRYHQQWTITAFDSGAYLFPSIAVLSPDSQLLAQSQSLPFFVNTVAVDTTAAIRDIKNIARVPLTFKEILPWILLVLAIAAIVVGLYFLRKYLKNKKKDTPIAPKPDIPADTLALSQLEDLRTQGLWKQGRAKEYHTNLTDILRQYLYNQYDIDAAEMTSDQITEACSEKQDISAEQNDNLRQILQTADLVKFAKAEPQPWEHDRSMSQSVDFVSQTAAATKQRLLLMQQKQNDKTE